MCSVEKKISCLIGVLLVINKSCSEMHVVALIEEPIQSWQKPLVCSYTMERLFSFSILTARVFSVGDPANHAEIHNTTKKCQKAVEVFIYCEQICKK
uniref:Uncharacterized protein n=1 Tax=Periophthalmus magnuspinnatus TaxID=409849 RepID=A0A3B4BK30_9GOBI